MSPISEDDLDRLADYTAGVLDPDEAAEVERLIAGDLAWAEAHSGLVAAQPWLDGELSGLPREPMPVEVAARLDEAMRAAASGPGPSMPTQRIGAGQRTDPEAGDPLQEGLAEVVPLHRRRSWSRIALGTAAAAVVAVACVGGVATLRNTGTQSASSGSARVSGPMATQGKQPAAAVPDDGTDSAGIPTTASGTDYTHDSLALAGSASASRAPAVGPARSVPDVPDGLARLAAPAGLNGCLAAITAAAGGRPLSADYARYQGRPALIVVLSGGSARVVAVGPDCGVAGSGDALLDSLS